ncbi:hypothetical protein QEN19_001206 [Hanseniaspora menglaensis]
MSQQNDKIPDVLKDNILMESSDISTLKDEINNPDIGIEIKGIDYSKNESIDMKASDLVKAMKTMGFQASNLGKACEVIDKMRSWRGENYHDLSESDRKGSFEILEDGSYGKQRTTVFLGYTSNLISSGVRETLVELAKNKQVDCFVSSAGGIEEDIIKCLAPTYLGDFELKGAMLREKGLNRIGNMVIPNDNYCKFEDWIVPILDTMLEEQEAFVAKAGLNCNDAEYDMNLPPWTPSKFIRRLGKEINDESSLLYQCYKNNIPVYCPGLTDGSIGDMLFFHTFKSSPKQLRIDIVSDIRAINTMAMESTRAGMMILGGGLIKHHINNACLMRNGADFAVYINTGQEFDGSDAGARIDEAVSWGKIKDEALKVKIYSDVTLVFPLIVAATFKNGKNLEYWC